MKVTEQIDAIEASAINPYRLLAATRILACILMLPLLTIATDTTALLTGWFAQAMVEPLSFHEFIANGFKGATFSAFLPQTFKTAVYGLIIGLIACFQGMSTSGPRSHELGSAGLALPYPGGCCAGEIHPCVLSIVVARSMRETNMATAL